ncbi:hypothetical protein GMDG_08113 [Pseudogymnoascus destructans 20631-21]|uniref:Kynurenine formamidase n=1 Tax=Pseudogymnoascus destructans (strain ATCC MYA-4855 / 20631-21) TaxID=658429 RepID=L8G4B3_PSED2|nr:hypothetical protein GMDG_08113 [Pseudogymnoascus destructans 20631-21]
MTVETPLKHVRHSYRDGEEATALSTVDIWLPETNPDGSSPEGIWVVFIHGGAWRDPLIDSTSFQPTLSILSQTPPQAQPPIAGYASINYRLSPYPSHPTSPSTGGDASRAAQHPEHLDDVTTALLFLDEKYGIGGRSRRRRRGGRLPVPLGMLGSEGIYDIPSLISRNEHPIYREFVVSAFGEREETWSAASPSMAPGSKLWEKTGVLIMSHSEEDEYVEKAQSVDMLERIKEVKKDGQAVYVEAEGKHDEMHEKGGEMARIIGTGLEMVWVVGWGA